MGAKTSNYSGHGLTLEQPRGFMGSYEQHGEGLAVSPHKENNQKLQHEFIWGPWKYLGQVLRAHRLYLN